VTARVADKMERLMPSGAVRYFDSQEGRPDASINVLQFIEGWINLSTDTNAEPVYPSPRPYSVFGLSAVASEPVSTCLRHMPNRLRGEGVYVTRLNDGNVKLITTMTPAGQLTSPQIDRTALF
jgi:hypothetical protein